MSTTRLAAHRGGARLWPENSLRAFREALALGVDLLELDVHLSADGEVVVIHDPTLDRTTTGTGPVVDRTAAELRAWYCKNGGGIRMPITADKRGYVAGKYGIELGDALAGWVQSVEGGHAFSDVVSEKLGPDHIIHKHIANVRYDDITITCGTGMTKPFYEWIKASFDRKNTRKDGAVVTADYSYKEISRMTFNHALISEIGFPALDASSKDAAKITVKITPETTRMKTGSGKQLGKVEAKIQKKWLPSNFRLKIDGLDCAYSAEILDDALKL